ncbi:Chloroperoxidase [Lactifluus subvellereus]|nr:Chloroperoxidase [Lactifluus subvellereus]
MSAVAPPTHDGKVASGCPLSDGLSHEWHPKQPGQVRSPCPALNTLANYGYLPRDGKQLTPPVLIRALREGYRISTPLAYILVYGGVGLLGQLGAFGLDDLARHNRIEHDASLVHDDTPKRDEYAPISPDSTLVRQFMNSAKDGHLMTVEDIARARVSRESQSRALDNLHAEIARGEMAIVVGLFSQKHSGKTGIPVDMLRVWMSEERLPDGWKPTHTQGLLQTIRTSRQISSQMKRIEEEHATNTLNHTSPYGIILVTYYFIRAALRFLLMICVYGVST